MDADAYDVVFESTGPMGIDIESSEDGRDAYIQKSQNPKIKPGHMLTAVNQEPLVGLTFDEILEKVKNAKHPRTLSFSTKKRTERPYLEDQFPLPEDFFKGFSLNEKEEAEIKAFMDGKLTEALKLATASPAEAGLSLVKESSGVTIHSKPLPGSNIRLIRATTRVNIAADLFMYAALAPDNKSFKRIFTMLDPMFRDGQVLAKIPKSYDRYGGKEHVAENINLPFYSVKWAAYALPFPLWSRDFVFCELTCWKDGYGVSLAMSMPQITAKVKSLEDSHQLVRGNIGMSGYVWRNVPGTDPNKPLGEGHMMTEITYLLQVEPRGVIPEWAVNLTGAEQGMNCLRVVGYAEEQRRLVLKMYEENPELNRTEVMKLNVPKGASEAIEFNVDRAGREIIFDWILEDNDVSFSIVGPDGASTLLTAAKERANMGTKAFHGRVKAKTAGVHKFVFDNSYSWFTGKLVFYHFLVL